jgi:hypothetical protein
MVGAHRERSCDGEVSGQRIMTRDVETRRIANATTEFVEHDEIEVTPEMIEAGREELVTFDHDFDDPRDIAKRIYIAMKRRAARGPLQPTRAEPQ